MHDTESDVAIRSALVNLNNAIGELSKVIIKECAGSDRYESEYYSAMDEAFQLMIKAKRKLTR